VHIYKNYNNKVIVYRFLSHHKVVNSEAQDFVISVSRIDGKFKELYQYKVCL